MTLHVGTDNIVDIRKNGKISKVYKGSDLVWGYPSGKVLFENSTGGTYTLTVKYRCKLYIQAVGGGGGGHTDGAGYHPYNYGGGSGAYIYGTKEVAAGTYTIVVGKVATGNTNGGDSSVFGEIAGGGKASTGGGGVAVTTLSYINGNNGGFGNVWEGPGGASVYGGYGTGMTANNGGLSGGTNGYVKITAI